MRKYSSMTSSDARRTGSSKHRVSEKNKFSSAELKFEHSHVTI